MWALSAEEKANQRAWAKKVHDLSCRKLSKDFNDKMKRYVPNGITVDACKTEANNLKCRYADVHCIDQSRVVLKNRQGDDDFIHANWVGSTAPGATKYICTQGPLAETQEAFWHMCHTEKTSIVLMLGNYFEGSAGIEKCSHYFPEKANEKMVFGNYTVTMLEKLDQPVVEDTDVSVLEIKCNTTGETMELRHVFARYWIDNCAPAYTEPTLTLWKWIRQNHNNCPVVVLCSAGVGRAGTFIGIEIACAAIAANPDTIMLEPIKELRQQRYQAVQSHVQFLYLHALVVDLLVQEGIAEAYSDSKFVGEYQRHTKKRTERAKRMIAQSFVESKEQSQIKSLERTLEL